ncbi:MAG: terminase large subunit domain-containing protein [Candidatus Zixiibacteriota bacterium]
MNRRSRIAKKQIQNEAEFKLITPPRGPLKEIVFDDARFKVVVSGRRLGKTGQGLRWLLKRAIECPKPTWENWYIAPYYSSARDIAWLRLKELIPKELIEKISETRLNISIKGGGRIALKGADKPGSLVGRAVYSAVFDEYGAMKSETWEYLRPAFADTKGSAIFIGTPRGANHFRELYLKAKSGDIEGFQAYPVYKTIDSPFVTEDEVLSARKQMDPRLFRQEFEGSFETWSGLVYDNFDIHKNAAQRFRLREDLPIYIGMDFGWVDPAVALWLQYDNEKQIWYIISEFVRSYTSPETLFKVLSGEDVQLPEMEFKAPCRIDDVKYIITGNEMNIRRQEAGGRSMKAILRSLGIPSHMLKIKSPRIFESIQAVRAKISDADGKPHLFIDPSCKNTIADFMSWHYPEKNGQIQGELPDNSPSNHKHSHTMDALRYAINYISPLVSKGKWIGLGK